MEYESIIGLEIHVQLKTRTKMFCSCGIAGENDPPNTHICPICMGHPGTLPTPNKEALFLAVKAAKAITCTITPHTKFDRKHYFYPDLPKAYQISQFDQPVGTDGYVDIAIPEPNAARAHTRVRIHRLHIEEDAAKNIHDGNGKTFVDFNRSGVPLIEIVTEADLRSPEEAKYFLQELRAIIRAIGASDADMEKGHLRCDANISLRPAGDTDLYPKTEIKNINSFRSVERAIVFEIDRQKKSWDAGTPIDSQSTRGWNDEKQITVLERSKEAAHDYRFFPEPDIPPFNLAALEKEVVVPELPQARYERFMKEYCFTPADAHILAYDSNWANFAEQSMSELYAWFKALPSHKPIEEETKRLGKITAGWIINKLMKLMDDAGVSTEKIPITPENFAEFISLVHTNQVHSTNAQKLLALMLETGMDPTHIMEEKQLGNVADSTFISDALDRVIAAHPKEVERYRQGKKELAQFFVGKTMKETEGKADPGMVRRLLTQKLGE